MPRRVKSVKSNYTAPWACWRNKTGTLLSGKKVRQTRDVTLWLMVVGQTVSKTSVNETSTPERVLPV